MSQVDLRALRLRAGLSARELAARAGTSHSTLLAYESGRKIPRADTRDRIVRAAGWVADPVTVRRIRQDERGTPRGVELEDVMVLADAFPDRRPRTHLDAPPFPRRRPAGRTTGDGGT